MTRNLNIIIYLIYNYFIIIGTLLLENPIEIMNTDYFLAFNSNSSSCNIITLRNISIINKLNGTEIKNIFFNTPEPPLVIVNEGPDNLSLIASNDSYKI